MLIICDENLHFHHLNQTLLVSRVDSPSRIFVKSGIFGIYLFVNNKIRK